MNLKERIRLARTQRGLTQKELSDNLGLRRSAVANWESSGGSSPSSDRMAGLARALDVSYEWLATGRGEMRLPDHLFKAQLTDAEIIEDVVERRLLTCWRALPAKLRVAVLVMIEESSRHRR